MRCDGLGRDSTPSEFHYCDKTSPSQAITSWCRPTLIAGVLISHPIARTIVLSQLSQGGIMDPARQQPAQPRPADPVTESLGAENKMDRMDTEFVAVLFRNLGALRTLESSWPKFLASSAGVEKISDNESRYVVSGNQMSGDIAVKPVEFRIRTTAQSAGEFPTGPDPYVICTGPTPQTQNSRIPLSASAVDLMNGIVQALDSFRDVRDIPGDLRVHSVGVTKLGENHSKYEIEAVVIREGDIATGNVSVVIDRELRDPGSDCWYYVTSAEIKK
jgi:hypothetical protein